MSVEARGKRYVIYLTPGKHDDILEHLAGVPDGLMSHFLRGMLSESAALRAGAKRRPASPRKASPRRRSLEKQQQSVQPEPILPQAPLPSRSPSDEASPQNLAAQSQVKDSQPSDLSQVSAPDIFSSQAPSLPKINEQVSISREQQKPKSEDSSAAMDLWSM